MIVGGDGFYNEAVNGLQRRLMKEAGINENDSNSDLQPMPLPIGVIPAGRLARDKLAMFPYFLRKYKLYTGSSLDFSYYHLQHDVTSGSDKMPCNKIDKPLVVCR